MQFLYPRKKLAIKVALYASPPTRLVATRQVYELLHCNEKPDLRERSAFIAPQCVSSEAWPLSPTDVGFHGLQACQLSSSTTGRHNTYSSNASK